MHTTKLTSFLFSITLLAMLTPTLTAASHSSAVDRDDLDDEAVEEFPVPVLFGVTEKELVSDFGDARGGGTRSHEGQDMRAPKGTPVVSPTEAIVLSTGTGPSAGKYVYTANPGGETFRYMHLDSIADIDRGDELEVGDFIGTVGDTGNAPDGVYHLHFEVRDSKNKATDPLPRLENEFSVKEKMQFLKNILRDIDDEDEYADFLVGTFPDPFTKALDEQYRLPDEIEDAIEESTQFASVDALKEIQNLLQVVPALVSTDLSVGADGPLVQLVQLYLIFHFEGIARDRLAAATATGYYGSLTQAAVLEYQTANGVSETGVYDAATRKEMKK